MLTTTADRVSGQTSTAVNRRIRDGATGRIVRAASDPMWVERRLGELDREWDVERTLEANASVLAGAGVLLGAAVHRKWLLLPMVVTGFLLQHAVQGWCPPLAVLRRLGFRTAREIEDERQALKVLRGDYEAASALRELAPGERAMRAEAMARQ